MAVAAVRPISLRSSSPRIGEKIILGLLALCGALSIATTVGIVVVLFADAAPFLRQTSLGGFLFGTVWQPVAGRFGVLPLVVGTLLVTTLAVIVAVPLGLGAAMYLSDYAAPRVRAILKPTLEVLAGIPTIVLGFFALTFVTPIIQGLLGEARVGIFNALSPGIVMGIMIIPTIASLSEDAMSAVPAGLRESGYGLGATKRDVILRVVFPGALSGIVAAIILGIGRAVGETMIVVIAAGSTPVLTFNPLRSIQTMTAYIVQVVGGEAPRGTVPYQSLFAVGALLFVSTLVLNILAERFVRRFREVY
jgi:phosphate transport system permease protein